MSLEQTWRWFGPQDPVSLKEIKQTGAEGIVTALHHIPVGDVWPVNEIMKRKTLIESEGLRWSVVESLPVHEDIKKRRGQFKRLLENYRESLRNLGTCGIDVVCYNFMPVLDWSRTALDMVFRDGSITTRFDPTAFAAFDLFLLKRRGAGKDYDTSHFEKAKAYFERLGDQEQQTLIRTVLFGLPGSGETYTLEELSHAIQDYEGISANALREHLREFLLDVIPAAEESHVQMAIHPDDPPWSLLGLPRVVTSSPDVEYILGAVESTANGLTLCTGSFGASSRNDLVAMAKQFAHRISFIHLRNVRRSDDGTFYEENHFEGDVDLVQVMKTLLLEQQRRIREGRPDRRMPMRPDHGHLMIPDQRRANFYPGYSLFGRMRALAELRGLELGILRSLEV